MHIPHETYKTSAPTHVRVAHSPQPRPCMLSATLPSVSRYGRLGSARCGRRNLIVRIQTALIGPHRRASRTNKLTFPSVFPRLNPTKRPCRRPLLSLHLWPSPPASSPPPPSPAPSPTISPAQPVIPLYLTSHSIRTRVAAPHTLTITQTPRLPSSSQLDPTRHCPLPPPPSHFSDLSSWTAQRIKKKYQPTPPVWPLLQPSTSLHISRAS